MLSQKRQSLFLCFLYAPFSNFLSPQLFVQEYIAAVLDFEGGLRYEVPGLKNDRLMGSQIHLETDKFILHHLQTQNHNKEQNLKPVRSRSWYTGQVVARGARLLIS